MKIKLIFLYSIPVIIMISLIRFVSNDYFLTAIYVGITIALLKTKPQKNDITILLFGLVAITISELFFVSTGVETFSRRTLFGLIPVWIPFLWAYSFVTINRVLKIIEKI